jgi:hypothetical protein
MAIFERAVLLHSLPKILAERHVTEIRYAPDLESATRITEAVIREAIDKTLEEAERAITVTHIQPTENCTNSLQVIIARQTYLGAIRSLKQSNSGMEVRK